AVLAEGAFPEPAALVFQPRPQGVPMERPSRRNRHRANLLAVRARPGNRHCRQPDGPFRNPDGAGVDTRASVHHTLPHRGGAPMTIPADHPNLSLVKPNRPKFVEVDELAAMVRSDESFGVGGHHFARLPIALLRAIGKSGVKNLRYVSWAGGLPLELLLEAEAVAEIDICFSSLDIFGLPPRFRAAAEADALPVRDWTALAMIQALR